ncbi:hypothetical protein MCOR29_005094 [Pyricularia oryzae]|uniref:Uncharacterized protein n=1 Tax=Pyricularia grisea TaxID=148305 RepID=A0ABQ8NFA2_PYRGI|nr:hypothetical protein MCOR01_000581 [Pyricularia oryzae]KAI6296139.1 hypothetical protein MCOR33_007172 [Pyricularia grisea]KAI6320962.1 hypothetical protein MCOR29_005094 [Pyricularia oryzae]KAI6340480.1 hypothetical protein MCOR28_006578 [Pyricularia oryzae]KAI6364452.1 hypothetical protein MCOR31_007418 [Pyricularia oryzae]
MPMLWTMYFLNYLERNAIAVAKINKIEKDMALDKTVGHILVCPSHRLACIATMLVSWSSGRLKERTWHITISTLVAVASFIVATSVENTAGRYAGMIIFCIGTYGVNSLMLGRCGSVCGQMREKKSAGPGTYPSWRRARRSAWPRLGLRERARWCGRGGIEC